MIGTKALRVKMGNGCKKQKINKKSIKRDIYSSELDDIKQCCRMRFKKSLWR